MRTRTSRTVIAALAALTMLMALAPAAVAGDDASSAAHVAVFRGEALVNPGLHFPGLGGPVAAGTWSFEADSANPNHLCASLPGDPVALNFDCRLEVAGELGPVLGSVHLSPVGTVGPAPSSPLGAWCGLSGGHSGGSGSNVGVVADALGSHQVWDVGWLASAGSVLPVTGAWDGGQGQLVAFVQASGSELAQHCATSGAEAFDVNGVAGLF